MAAPLPGQNVYKEIDCNTDCRRASWYVSERETAQNGAARGEHKETAPRARVLVLSRCFARFHAQINRLGMMLLLMLIKDVKEQTCSSKAASSFVIVARGAGDTTKSALFLARCFRTFLANNSLLMNALYTRQHSASTNGRSLKESQDI